MFGGCAAETRRLEQMKSMDLYFPIIHYIRYFNVRFRLLLILLPLWLVNQDTMAVNSNPMVARTIFIRAGMY